jgi:hypothetical protein
MNLFFKNFYLKLNKNFKDQKIRQIGNSVNNQDAIGFDSNSFSMRFRILLKILIR